MAYQKINWANGEAGNTPLNANNLNKMDDALDDFESRIGDNEYKVETLETTVAGHTTAINGKMDKNNPTGTGTLNITNVKCTSVDAVGDTFTLSDKARFSVGSTMYSMSSIVNNMVSQSDLNTALLTKVNTTNPTTSGTMTHTGSADFTNVNTGNLYAFGYSVLNEICPTDGGSIAVQADLKVAGDVYQGGSSTGLGAKVSQNEINIAANTEAINSLSDRCGFEITSASPLNGCSASSIVGIDACGNSTQSGTPTPTNPISIVDASGDVVAHTINLCNVDNIVLGKSWDATTVNASRGYVEITDFVVDETYTLSAVSLNGLSSISAMPLSGNNLVGSAKTVDANTSSVSFGIASTVDKIRILYVAPSGTLTQAMAEGTKTMFCKGTSTDYIAYASNKITLPTLRSVGNVKDELIVNADGSGQIVRRVGKTTLNVTLSAGTSKTMALSGISSAYGRLSIISDCFPCAYSGDNYICVNSEYSGLVMQSATAYSGDVVVYYPLATPTETTLTASEVSAIRQLQTYSGTTIIDSALDVKSVSYNADAKAYIDERTNYKTEETLIGYWTDGKPLYRQVLKGATTNASSGGMVKGFYCADKSIKKFDGVINVTSSNQVVPINFYYPNSLYAYTYMTNGGIWCRTSNDLYYQPIEIVIEYTYKDTEDSVSVLSDDDEYYGLIDTPDDENIIGIITEG